MLRGTPSCRSRVSGRLTGVVGQLRDPGELLGCEGVANLLVARPYHADEPVLEQPTVREAAQARVELGGDDEDVRLAALKSLMEACGQGLDPDRDPGSLGIEGGDEMAQQDEGDVVAADYGEGACVGGRVEAGPQRQHVLDVGEKRLKGLGQGLGKRRQGEGAAAADQQGVAEGAAQAGE